MKNSTMIIIQAIGLATIAICMVVIAHYGLPDDGPTIVNNVLFVVLYALSLGSIIAMCKKIEDATHEKKLEKYGSDKPMVVVSQKAMTQLEKEEQT